MGDRKGSLFGRRPVEARVRAHRLLCAASGSRGDASVAQGHFTIPLCSPALRGPTGALLPSDTDEPSSWAMSDRRSFEHDCAPETGRGRRCRVTVSRDVRRYAYAHFEHESLPGAHGKPECRDRFEGDVDIEHLSEVVKILEGALRHNPRQSVDYALLLADKLDRAGSGRQASLLRSVLSKSPAQAVTNAASRLPMDDDSRLATVDVAAPDGQSAGLILPPYTERLVREFLASVHAFDRLQARGVAVSNRLLIHGPPGTGKTTIARRVAEELQLPLVTTRSDTLVSSLLGQTSKNIREVFDYAAQAPCVLFLDEFDALGKDRADTREIGELQRVVIALLQNMDALGASTVLVAATNHPQLLDPAVWRRFPHKIQTELPGLAERQQLWLTRVGDLDLAVKDAARLAAGSEGLSPAAIESAAFDVARDAILSGSDTVDLVRAFRRLARFVRYEEFDLFNDEANEIRFLRGWAPDVFTMRALAATFETSTRRVGMILAEANDDRAEPDPVDAVRSAGAPT